MWVKLTAPRRVENKTPDPTQLSYILSIYTIYKTNTFVTFSCLALWQELWYKVKAVGNGAKNTFTMTYGISFIIIQFKIQPISAIKYNNNWYSVSVSLSLHNIDFTLPFGFHKYAIVFFFVLILAFFYFISSCVYLCLVEIAFYGNFFWQIALGIFQRATVLLISSRYLSPSAFK